MYACVSMNNTSPYVPRIIVGKRDLLIVRIKIARLQMIFRKRAIF